MSTISHLTQLIVAFRDARQWDQEFQPKSMVISLMVEVGELAAHFQYLTEAELEAYFDVHRTEIGEELADVLWWVLLIAHDWQIQLPPMFVEKMRLNEAKFKSSQAVAYSGTDKLETMTSEILQFRHHLGWNPHSHPRDFILKLIEEVGEVAEYVQWKTGQELNDYLAAHRSEIGHELIDVLYNVLLLFEFLEIPVESTFLAKLEKNGLKYPVS